MWSDESFKRKIERILLAVFCQFSLEWCLTIALPQNIRAWNRRKSVKYKQKKDLFISLISIKAFNWGGGSRGHLMKRSRSEQHKGSTPIALNSYWKENRKGGEKKKEKGSNKWAAMHAQKTRSKRGIRDPGSEEGKLKETVTVIFASSRRIGTPLLPPCSRRSLRPACIPACAHQVLPEFARQQNAQIMLH